MLHLLLAQNFKARISNAAMCLAYRPIQRRPFDMQITSTKCISKNRVA